MIDVEPGTVVLYSDVGCPWAHMAVHRLHDARHRLGLEGSVSFDHRAFPLEVINKQPTPRPVLETEMAVLGRHDPEAGWQTWQAPESTWPVTTLPPLEAVQAAKAQGRAESEALDRGLRVAFFAQSRCISLRSVILEVAEEQGLDVDRLRQALDTGSDRAAVMEQCRVASGDDVDGSPHAFLPDGTDAHNPGVTMHWDGEPGTGILVVDEDRPDAYDDLLRRAAQA